MSLAYNDTTAYKGIVQIYEKKIGAERGFISGNTTRLKEFTADVNLAMDSYWNVALTASGTWQLDDSNQTDYPVIYTNIVSGQRDYTITTDGSSNLVLDMYKVLILPSATATEYTEIDPFDAQQSGLISDANSETSATGVPYSYDKTANGIFLEPKPSYSATNGLKIYINREPSYFTYTDTTRKPGVRGTHHKYFALKPAYDYACIHQLRNKDDLWRELLILEDQIKKDYGARSKDERKNITLKKIMYI